MLTRAASPCVWGHAGVMDRFLFLQAPGTFSSRGRDVLQLESSSFLRMKHSMFLVEDFSLRGWAVVVNEVVVSPGVTGQDKHRGCSPGWNRPCRAWRQQVPSPGSPRCQHKPLV